MKKKAYTAPQAEAFTTDFHVMLGLESKPASKNPAGARYYEEDFYDYEEDYDDFSGYWK